MTSTSGAAVRKVLQVALVVACGFAAFALSAGWFAPGTQEDVVQARSRPDTKPVVVARTQLQVVPDASPEPQMRLAPEAQGNPFGRLNLLPPAAASVGSPPSAKAAAAAPAKPVPPPVPADPPAPSAPPLPFVALGSIEGADATAGLKIAFLQQQDSLLVVRKGESIGQLYRVEDVSADRVEFTYLPLNQRQSLSLAH